MHAHICQNCLKNGKNTIWVHSDDNAGDIAAHKCPECGVTEWKKASFHPQRKEAHVNHAAQPHNQNGGGGFYGLIVNLVNTASLVLIGIAVVYYGILIYDYFAAHFGKAKVINPPTDKVQ